LDTFHQSTKESEVYKKENTQRKYIRGPMKDSVRYIPCVRCRKLMNRKNFGRISGVIIDECGSHGVWLDAGELEKIRIFIADGGLEKAQDKEIEKIKGEVGELAREVGQTKFMQRLLHFWNFKRWLFGSR
jgi:Zn-finger nucleic acid-binding protein